MPKLNKKITIALFGLILILGLGISFYEAKAASIISFFATPLQIPSGGSTTLYWVSMDATSCVAAASPSHSQWSLSKANSGNQPIVLTTTTTFYLTCSGAGSSSNKSVTVTVTAPAATVPTVPTLSSPVVSATSVFLSWSSTLASGQWYNLNYKKSDASSYATAASSLTSKSYTLSGLSPSTAYNWVVQVCSSTACTNSAIGSFTTQAAATTPTPTTCTDSDGGKDYYTKGETQDLGSTYRDYCLSNSTLREYFCLTSTLSPGGTASQEDYTCLYGCQDGACLTAATPTPTPSPTATCDSISFATHDTAFDFGTAGGTVSNVCGQNQYFKVTIPSGQTCGIKWTLQPDANSDYDLYVRWGTGTLLLNSYDDSATYSKGIKDEVLKAGLSAGTYYAMVNKPYPAGTTGSYSITASLTNCTFPITPTPTPTPTAEIQAYQAQIAQLTAQIAQLTAQLTQLLAGQPSWCYTFKQNLGYKDSGTADVTFLQTALQKEGVYTGTIDSYYGISTLEAVISFQVKYKADVLTPWGLTRGTGFVGAKTIKKLNELYGCK